MDFQKKVTYLYEYNCGKRSIGFAKWDVRNGMLKLQAEIKLPDAGKDGGYEIFTEAYDRTRIHLGNMKITDGLGGFRYMGMSDNIQNSGIPYNKITGFYIIKNGQIVFNGEFIEKSQPIYEACEAVNIIQSEKHEKNGYEKLYDERQTVDLFSDGDLYDCVEIEPEDIKKFPDTNWGLMDNSFLNHGFYAYRHLILGKQDKQDGFDYIIGVPGIYTRRDKSMANMFGFLHFKFSTRSDIRLSQFGYWYKTLVR